MKIQVNHEHIEFNGSTIFDLMNDSNINRQCDQVVIVNNSVILKKQWSLYKLKEADSIFIITPADGG